jgi:membrane-bound lytic murein transglycosylase F
VFVRLTSVVCAGVLALALPGCAPEGSHLEQIKARSQLRVVTLNQPTTYYLGAHGAQGYEFRLASALARRLDVQLVVEPVSDPAAMYAALRSGEADIAAAQLTNDETSTDVLLSSTYRRVAQVVVQRRGTKPIRDVTAMRGLRIVVRANSPQSKLLASIRGNGAPYLSWTELPRDRADPLDWVASDDADCAIVDETEYQFSRFLNPDAVIAFRLPDSRPVQWLIAHQAPDLRDAVNAFFADAERNGTLARLDKDAQAELHRFEYLEAQRYQEDIATRLPQLRQAFETAAAAQGLDWRLLAALAYQESKWQSDAESADGAVGLMMLTESTAASVGVKNRLDPSESIAGGGAYFARVVQMLPAHILEPDRTWFALAAYNVGFGHVEDARILAQSQGRDPDAWSDVSKSLPLLAEERWYTQAKRGYARGWEPVNFVSQVRDFLAVLEWASTDAGGELLSPVVVTAPRKKALK